MKKVFIFFAVLFAAFTLAACAEDEVVSLQISDTFLEIELGDTETISLVVTPSNSNESVVWTSLNPNIATVSSTGTVTAESLGSTNIRVTVGNTSETLSVVVVPVPEPAPEPEPEPEPEAPVPNAVQITGDFSSVTVPFGASLSDVLDELPSSLTLIDDLGTSYDVNVTWIVPAFDSEISPDSRASFQANGTFVLPSGVNRNELDLDVSVEVFVETSSTSQALKAINDAPLIASLDTFNRAGIKGVNASNISIIQSALSSDKGGNINPGWMVSDIQSVVDDVNFNRGTYRLNFDIEDGQLMSVNLRQNNVNHEFGLDQISNVLISFFELNHDLLSGQDATFTFTNQDTNVISAIESISIVNPSPFVGMIFIIPNHSAFNGLSIDANNHSLVSDFVIGSNNITIRNATNLSVVTFANAANLELDNVTLLNGTFTNDVNLDINDVTLIEGMGYNPYYLLPYESQTQTFLSKINQEDIGFGSMLPLLTQNPENIIGSIEGLYYHLYLFEFSLSFTPDIYQNSQEVFDYVKALSESGILSEEGPSEEFFAVYATPTLDSLTLAKNYVNANMFSDTSKENELRFLELLSLIKPISDFDYLPANESPTTLPTVTFAGELMIDDEAYLIGNFNNLRAITIENDAELYLYQGTKLDDFVISENFEIELGDSSFSPFGFFNSISIDILDNYSSIYNDEYSYSQEIILKDGTFHNRIFEDHDDSNLVLLGTINGNGAFIEVNGEGSIDVFIGTDPNQWGLNFIASSTLSVNPLNPGNASINHLNFDGVNVLVYGPNNTMNNVTVSSLVVAQNSVGELTLTNSNVLTNASIGTLSESTLTISNTLFAGNVNFDLEPSTVSFGEGNIYQNEGLIEIIAATNVTLSGLANLNPLLLGDPLQGETFSTNLSGSALDFQWQTATAAGVYTTVSTAPSISLTAASVGLDYRLVVSGGGDVLTLSGISTVDANVWNATASSLTVTESTVSADTNNVDIAIELHTENGYDVTNVTDYAILVTLGSVTLYSENLANISNAAAFTISLTEAGIITQMGVFVSVSGSGVTPTQVGSLLSFTVQASTPASIQILTPAALTDLGTGSETLLAVQVKDAFGNNVPNTPVTFSALGANLEVGTAFSDEVGLTDDSGIARSTFSVDPMELAQDDQVTLAAIIPTDQDEFARLDFEAAISEESSARLPDAFSDVGAGDTFDIELTLLDTKEIGQSLNYETIEAFLVLGTLESGTVVATASSIDISSTTGTATFAITIAGEHELNLYAETFPGSGQFVLVQDNLDVTVVADVPNELSGSTSDGGTVDYGIDSTNSITLTLVDQYDNPLDDIIITYALTGNVHTNTAINGSQVTGSFVTEADGTVEFTLDIDTEQSFNSGADLTLTFDVSGSAVDYTFDVDVLQFVSDLNSELDDSIKDDVIVVADDNITLDFVLKDANDDVISTGNFASYLELSDGTTISAILSAGVTRTATYTLTDSTINTQNIEVFVETFAGSEEFVRLENNLDLDVVNATIAAVNVSPGVTSLTQVAVGTENVFVVTAVDAFGNPIADYLITLTLEGRMSASTEIDSGDTDTSLEIETNALGEATFELQIGGNEPLDNVLSVTISGPDDFDTQTYNLTIINE